MKNTEFANNVVEWLRGNRWTISKGELTDSVLMIKGKRNDDGVEKLLALIATEEGAVSKKHIKYLLSKAKKADVGTVQVASEHGLNSELSAFCNEYGVSEIDSSEITGTTENRVESDQHTQTESGGSDPWNSQEENGDSDRKFWTRRKALIGVGGALSGGVALDSILSSGDSNSDDAPVNQDNEVSESGFPENPREDETRTITVPGDVKGEVVLTGKHRDKLEFPNIEYLDNSETDGDKVGVKMQIQNPPEGERGIAAFRLELYLAGGRLYDKVIESEKGTVGYTWVHENNIKERTYLTDAPSGNIEKFILRFHLNGENEPQNK
jgi:hypothetical protein